MKKKEGQSEQDNLGNPLLVASAVGGAGKVLVPLVLGGAGLYMLYSLLKGNDGKYESLNFKEWWLKDEHGVSYNALEIAMNYRTAIEGAGTYEDQLYELAKISRGARWSKILEAYFKATKRSLMQDIQGDLSSTEYNTFMAIKNDTENTTDPADTSREPFKFSVGETVDIKSSGTAYQVVKYEDGTIKASVERLYDVFGNVGKIIERRRFKQKSDTSWTNFYKVEDYANMYITGHALTRV